MNDIEKNLLREVAEIEKVPIGAYNIRENGEGIKRNVTENINIVTKKDKPGIDIIIKENTKNESVHIPVIITQGGLTDIVYNDFYIGKDCDVTIIAGCGIHNKTCKDSQHDGIHSFHVGENSKVRYVEKHYGAGEGSGKKILNPITKIAMKKASSMEFESIQIGGVSSTVRKTYAKLQDDCVLNIKENILTTDEQYAKTYFKVELLGENSKCDVVSHSVAEGHSYQEFISDMIGKNKSFGHVECDGILMDEGRIVSVPKIDAISKDASLVHEAAIGKIAGDQLIKLMSLGLSQEEAEKTIIKGFLYN